MPAAIPLLTYAAASAVGLTATTASLLAFGASLVVGAYEERRARQAARDAYNASLTDRGVVLRSSIAPRNIVYGEVAVSGPLAYACSSGAKKEFLHLVILLAGHECEAITDVIFADQSIGTLDANGYVSGGRYFKTKDDNFGRDPFSSNLTGGSVTLSHIPNGAVTINAHGGGDEGDLLLVEGTDYSKAGQVYTLLKDFGTYTIHAAYTYTTGKAYVQVKKFLGSTSQAADSDLVTASGGQWTTNHRLRGITYIRVTLEYEPDLFPNGVPNIKAVVRGRKVYDPRTDITAWSQNPALCRRDYLTLAAGFGCAATEIDDATVIAAANVDDEMVATDGVGGTQRRYQCNTSVSMAASPRDNLEILNSASQGKCVRVGGQWKVYSAAYRTPVMSLTEDDLADTGSMSPQPRAPRRELFNAVKGVYIAPTKYWQPSDFPIVRNPTYKSQDGGEEIVKDIELPATTDAIMAQRIAKIVLEQARQALTFTASWKWKAYKLSPGDTVTLSIARYGWTNKVFLILKRRFSPTGGIELVMKEEAAGVYDWNYGQATLVDLAPNSNLPNPFTVARPVSVTLASGDSELFKAADGTVISRMKVSWPQSTDANVLFGGGKVEIEINRAGEDAWSPVSAARGDETVVWAYPVKDDAYYFARVRFVNNLGVRSLWTYSTAHRVLGKSAPPADLMTFTVSVLPDGTRRFQWTGMIPLDVEDVEIRWSSSTNLWASMASKRRFRARDLQGESNLPPAGSYYFAIKMVDTSGNESIAALTTVLTAISSEPLRVGASANMLRNSSFSEVTGQSGAGQFHYWTWGVNGVTNVQAGRADPNFNLPPGGAWMFDNSNIGDSTKWQLLTQDVVVRAGTEYEAHYIGSAHRVIQGGLQLQWFDAGGNYISETNDLQSVGTGTLGGGGSPDAMYRWWCKMVAPVGAVKGRFVIHKKPTASGASPANSYLFADKCFLGPASPGSSKTAPTPWVDSGVGGVHGGGIDDGTVTTGKVKAGDITSAQLVTISSWPLSDVTDDITTITVPAQPFDVDIEVSATCNMAVTWASGTASAFMTFHFDLGGTGNPPADYGMVSRESAGTTTRGLSLNWMYHASAASMATPTVMRLRARRSGISSSSGSISDVQFRVVVRKR